MRRNFFCKKDGYTEKDLLHFGYDHIDTGLALLKNAHHACYDSAGYLIQLGFEIILKAWHLHEFECFEDTHDLNYLVNKLRDNGCEITLDTKETKTLTTIDSLYKLRYPRRVAGPVGIGSELADDFELLLNSIWETLPKELIDAYGEIDRTKKSGRVLMRKPID